MLKGISYMRTIFCILIIAEKNFKIDFFLLFRFIPECRQNYPQTPHRCGGWPDNAGCVSRWESECRYFRVFFQILSTCKCKRFHYFNIQWLVKLWIDIRRQQSFDMNYWTYMLKPLQFLCNDYKGHIKVNH